MYLISGQEISLSFTVIHLSNQQLIIKYHRLTYP